MNVTIIGFIYEEAQEKTFKKEEKEKIRMNMSQGLNIIKSKQDKVILKKPSSVKLVIELDGLPEVLEVKEIISEKYGKVSKRNLERLKEDIESGNVEICIKDDEIVIK